MKANIDSNGKILGFYTKAIHEDMPEGCVPISNDDWQAHCGHLKECTYTDGVWVCIDIEQGTE